MSGTSDHHPTTVEPSLPACLNRYTTLGLYGLLVGTGLCLAAFVTNPVPDPPFPWATLPESLRLPFEQPQIEHWPVTYSIDIWLWILGIPALFLAGYRRLGARTPFGLATLAEFREHLVLVGTDHCPIHHSYPDIPENRSKYDFL